ncbi:MAG: FG-GAP-like repeat-containing protein, partial [Acidobacteriota bacterium]
AGAATLALLLALTVFSGASWAAEVPFDAYATIETSYPGARIISADLDGDGDLDLLGSTRNNEVTWWENAMGDGSTWTAHTLDASFENPRGIVAGDLDGDGDLDVAVAAFVSGAVRWYENDPSGALCGSPFCVATLTSSTFLSELAIGDLDHDGDLDLAVSAPVRGEVMWIENTAGDASAWSLESIDASLIAAGELALGDLDGDGDLDILAEARDTSAVGFAWYENTVGGGGSCAQSFCLQTLGSGLGEGLAIADLDGDGDPDLVRSELGAGLSWWNNTTGDGSSFTKTPITSSTTATMAIEPVDLDSDGDLDLLLGAGLWMDNAAGDASTWIERSLPMSAGGLRYAVGDFDLDGDG